MAIQSGTTVWLKSGGPCMTIKFFTAGKEWLCTWFAGDEIKEYTFMAEQLTENNPN
jgi:Uncharacterized small protein